MPERILACYVLVYMEPVCPAAELDSEPSEGSRGEEHLGWCSPPTPLQLSKGTPLVESVVFERVWPGRLRARLASPEASGSFVW